MEYRVTRQNRPRILDFLSRLDIAKDWVITIEPFRKKRSLNANARLWALHGLAAEVTGYAVEELHELMLKRHFGTKEVEVGGVVMEFPAKRSSVRNVKEFAEFMESVESFYICELGVWFDADAPARQAA